LCLLFQDFDNAAVTDRLAIVGIHHEVGIPVRINGKHATPDILSVFWRNRYFPAILFAFFFFVVELL